MTHTFRPRKGEGQGGSRRGRRSRSDGLPKTDQQSDLDLLPEIDYQKFDQMTPTELAKAAKAAKVSMDQPRSAVIEQLLAEANAEFGAIYARGILEIMNDGWGFLRRENYVPSPNDVYVSQSQIKRFGLKPGDMIFGQVRPPKEGERYQGMLRVESVNGLGALSPEVTDRRTFDELTPLHPDERLEMETASENITARIIDLISPIGKGQRGLIVSPPKAGKTSILKTIANAVSANHPEVYLMVLLVDERPEEVTDFRRSVKGQVVSSTFDEPAENHMRVAELCLEQAKRLVECGRDVVILLDSLTRLSRASNLTINPSGRTLSGGLDPSALYRPRRFFGSARNIEEGGSLTVIATALVDTGSRMDEAIFEEFKGTGNMEIVLDRDLAERRIWPAIDVKRSSTRHEEKLFRADELEGVVQLHRLLANQQNSWEATDSLIKLLKRTPKNAVFLESVVQRMKATV
ncbi:MAG: transcription termination factor Rho [Armatimonadetes bacterium]|uniref:Transcription termination factor Rho n=1 Tax=Candidatus Nitrosymbiomonas proteolyticus TaxID=2608984 RepID=A0A809S5L2_9BACT|nr:MAG: transcription termination factor Rho [Armatimonadota bacterium]MBV6491899.1 Transcription termination factor Rho [Fimbriimonadaceae bacterium]QOJ12326.1 MAG: transcription termination factor Rho [Chthonomonadaceae bacterium]BBO24206.1 transcription termination factor Rho [Candidatus Nitrosymbiomonas proteolyticus]MBL1152970.1 transcription termination factor Rho [Armatimonadota bacterium]